MKVQYLAPCMSIIRLDVEEMIATSVVDTQDSVGKDIMDESVGGGHAIWGQSGIWGK